MTRPTHGDLIRVSIGNRAEAEVLCRVLADADMIKAVLDDCDDEWEVELNRARRYVPRPAGFLLHPVWRYRYAGRLSRPALVAAAGSVGR